MKADIGLIGLAVMGKNLAMNIRDHGFRVAVFEYVEGIADDFSETQAKVEKIHDPEELHIVSTHSLKELVDNLQAPRVVFMMVRAGDVVDFYIDQLIPLLSEGDIIVDGGNSLFTDTNRRVARLNEKGLNFIGMGVSGGEHGAHYAGHYVKMVHNGIEYGDMQLICEAYQLLSEGLGLSHDELYEVFKQWNQGELSSYLIEITTDIFAHKDTDGQPLVEKILDTAGQKGTGKWTGINALDLGIPLTLIGEAVFARCLSSQKDERVRAAARLPKTKVAFTGDKAAMINAIGDALYAAKLISYAQGFRLMREASKEYHFALNYGDIALMWRGGCIIRSQFLNNIKHAYNKNPDLENLLLDDFFVNAMQKAEAGWRKAVILGIELSIPTPTFSSALAYYDGYRSEKLPANLLQAQRDYFGAHTYERTDKPRGEFFHTDWTGEGGDASATTYTV